MDVTESGKTTRVDIISDFHRLWNEADSTLSDQISRLRLFLLLMMGKNQEMNLESACATKPLRLAEVYVIMYYLKTDLQKQHQLCEIAFQVDRHQCTYSDQVSFPCSGPDVKPSFYKPRSVHRLRPGDVQIIAALGDSLVSGQGALSVGITTSAEQYRGVSFATGELVIVIMLHWRYLSSRDCMIDKSFSISGQAELSSRPVHITW